MWTLFMIVSVIYVITGIGSAIWFWKNDLSEDDFDDKLKVGLTLIFVMIVGPIVLLYRLYEIPAKRRMWKRLSTKATN